MSIYEKLSKIQDKLIANKDSFNDFGNYKYRSFEQIMAAVKPVVKKNGCVFYMTNDLETYGDRNYVKATVTLVDIETGEMISSTAHAREDLTEKGKNGCQITASCSTYARKNALMGLFCIDNEESKFDEDDSEDETSAVIAAAKRKADLLAFMNDKYSAEKLKEIADHYGLNSVSEMDDDDVRDYIRLLNNKEKKK